jgi:hypothetical protein
VVTLVTCGLGCDVDVGDVEMIGGSMEMMERWLDGMDDVMEMSLYHMKPGSKGLRVVKQTKVVIRLINKRSTKISLSQ